MLKNHCEDCMSNFTTEDLLWAHIGEKHMACGICKKRFKTIRKINNHLGIYHTKQYICEPCDNEFSTRKEFASHIMAIHKKYSSASKHFGKDEMFDCCFAYFSEHKTDSKRRLHTDIHKPKKVKCPDCQKGFRQQAHLDTHAPNCKKGKQNLNLNATQQKV